MNFSRRDFIKSGGISAIGIGIMLTNPQAAFGLNIFNNSSIETDLLATLDADSFANFIGKAFTLYSDDGAFQGILAEVIVAPSIKPKQLRSTALKSKTSNTFFLKFDVQSADLLQATYKLYEKTLGLFDLLLVPGNKFENKTILIATINRI